MMIVTSQHHKEVGMSFVDFKIFKIILELNDTKRPSNKKSENDVKLEAGYSYKKENKELKVILGITISGKESPYLLEIKCGGTFSFQNTPDKDRLDFMARVNCLAILYPYVRETIADITRRSGYPPLHLRPFNFVNLYESSLQKNKSPSGKKKIAK